MHKRSFLPTSVIGWVILLVLLTLVVGFVYEMHKGEQDRDNLKQRNDCVSYALSHDLPTSGC